MYSKFWQKVDTERGRFGSSVDDNALGASSLSSLQQSAAAAETAADGRMVAAAVAAGVRGIGKGGVHWGEHHHHHNLHHQHQRSSPGSDDGEGAAKEPLVRNTSAERRHVYLEKQQRERPVAVVAAQRARVQAIVAVHGVGGAAASSAVNVNANSNAGRGSTGRSPVGRGSPVLGGRGKNGSMLTGRGKNGSMLTSRRSMPDAWAAAAAAAAADPSGGMIGGGPGVGSAGSAGAGAGAAGAGGRMRRATNTGQGWESHTVQAQQKTQEYMQGREDLAPDMRPDVVLDNEVGGCGGCRRRPGEARRRGGLSMLWWGDTYIIGRVVPVRAGRLWSEVGVGSSAHVSEPCGLMVRSFVRSRFGGHEGIDRNIVDIFQYIHSTCLC